MIVTTQDKSTVEFSQNFVAFSEYMNFIGQEVLKKFMELRGILENIYLSFYNMQLEYIIAVIDYFEFCCFCFSNDLKMSPFQGLHFFTSFRPLDSISIEVTRLLYLARYINSVYFIRNGHHLIKNLEFTCTTKYQVKKNTELDYIYLENRRQLVFINKKTKIGL